MIDGIFDFIIILILQIITQGIASLFVVMYSVMYIAGDFKEIRATVDLESKSWETLRNLPSFQVFNHRGRSLSPQYLPKVQKSASEDDLLLMN